MRAAEIERLHGHLARLYGERVARETRGRFVGLVERFDERLPTITRRERLFDETDVLLVAYGDQVSRLDEPPLDTLRQLLTTYAAPEVSGLHLLPLHPSTSDDGFAVADYSHVDPRLGDWQHVAALAAGFRLMLDAVVNHTSSSHPWFTGWLAGDLRHRDFYLELDPATDLSTVTRPRTSPLLTEVSPNRWAWTTFSADQVDLNYTNPDVLLAVTEVLLEYVAYGAQALRLDAVAFLWKRVGTPCIHLPETHEVVRFWRTVLDLVAPGTLVITETNVPQRENIAYFGSGTDEAHLVYQFALPPLTLAAFHQRDGRQLGEWLSSVRSPSESTTFLNFLASHDGIGLRAAEGLLSGDQVDALCSAVLDNGGLVSSRALTGGRTAPYEINATYLDALRPLGVDEPQQRVVDRFLAAHAILFALAGVPLVYFQSLFGGRNWPEGVAQTGRARTINRERLTADGLERELADPTSIRRQVLDGIKRLLRARVTEPAFHPKSAQRWLPAELPGHLAIQRAPRDGGPPVVAVVDVSGDAGRCRVLVPGAAARRVVDLLDGSEHPIGPEGAVELPLPAYGVRWLKPV